MTCPPGRADGQPPAPPGGILPLKLIAPITDWEDRYTQTPFISAPCRINAAGCPTRLGVGENDL